MWAYIPTLTGRRFRREFQTLYDAKYRAAQEGRWGDWDDLDDRMTDHFVRRDAWLAKLDRRSRIYHLTWNDVKEDK